MMTPMNFENGKYISENFSAVSIASTDVTLSNATTVKSITVEEEEVYIVTTTGQFGNYVDTNDVGIYIVNGTSSYAKRGKLFSTGDIDTSIVIKAQSTSITLKIAQKNTNSTTITASGNIFAYKLS